MRRVDGPHPYSLIHILAPIQAAHSPFMHPSFTLHSPFIHRRPRPVSSLQRKRAPAARAKPKPKKAKGGRQGGIALSEDEEEQPIVQPAEPEREEGEDTPKPTEAETKASVEAEIKASAIDALWAEMNRGAPSRPPAAATTKVPASAQQGGAPRAEASKPATVSAAAAPAAAAPAAAAPAADAPAAAAPDAATPAAAAAAAAAASVTLDIKALLRKTQGASGAPSGGCGIGVSGTAMVTITETLDFCGEAIVTTKKVKVGSNPPPPPPAPASAPPPQPHPHTHPYHPLLPPSNTP